MKRVALVLIAVLMLTGCNPTVAQPIVTPSETTLKTPEPTPVSISATDSPGIVTTQSKEGELPPDYYSNAGLAIAPIPRAITITNYELGANFEFPVYIHNGDGLLAKLIKIQTEPGETIAAIPINAVLANNGLLDIVSLQSSIDEKLEAIAYDSTTKLLTIRGFTPSVERILKVTYRTVSTYELKYNLPPKGKYHAGYTPMPIVFKSFVELEKSIITLKPLESVIVKVKVTLPPNCKFPSNKLEFELLLEEVSTNSANMQMTKGIAQPVLIALE